MEQQKTKLGVSVGMLGALAYFLGLLGDVWGYLLPILLAAYVLKFEENEWLRRTVVKSVVILVLFFLLQTVVGLIPSLTNLIDSICHIFRGEFTVTWLTWAIGAINTIIAICRRVLLLLLCFKALGQSTVVIPPIDKLINKYM